MEFMEMQHAIVVSLIGFFGSWAIVLGQSCFFYIKSEKVSMGHSKEPIGLYETIGLHLDFL